MAASSSSQHHGSLAAVKHIGNETAFVAAQSVDAFITAINVITLTSPGARVQRHRGAFRHHVSTRGRNRFPVDRFFAPNTDKQQLCVVCRATASTRAIEVQPGVESPLCRQIEYSQAEARHRSRLNCAP